MGWFICIQQFFKVVFFLLNLKDESNKKKAADKAELGKELIDALAETDKDTRASRISSAIVKLRK